MDNLEYIEAYFNGEVSPERKKEFEQRIAADPVFAEEVAFYLTSKQAAAAEMKVERERFKEIYSNYKHDNPGNKRQPVLLRKLWPWAAAAAVLVGIIFGWNLWFKSLSPHELANNYVNEHFQTLRVTMGDKEDSLQAGLRLYNEGRMEDAMKHFESMALRDTSFAEAKKYAGIVSLRLGEYDKAINYFSQLEKNNLLYANPGKFYRAIALLKRNRDNDNKTAQGLLKQVIENDLEGKEIAEEWLKSW